MVGKEYIDFLKKNIDCFDFSVSDLNYLYNTHVESMGLMESRIYKITPILDQISLYACGAAFYNEVEYEFLEKLPQGEKLNEIMEACYNYMNELVENGCNHPTVLIYKDLVNGDNLYNVMMDDLSESVELVEGDIKDNIEDFLIKVDEKILDYRDDSLNKTVDVLNKVDSDKKIIKILGDNGRKRALTELLLATMYVSYHFDDTWTKIYASEEGDPNLTFEFLNLIQLIESNLPFLDFDDENDLENYFTEVREAYYMHKAFQCDYLKNSYKEARLLQKCKKM